jgi:hypothetical protein
MHLHGLPVTFALTGTKADEREDQAAAASPPRRAHPARRIPVQAAARHRRYRPRQTVHRTTLPGWYAGPGPAWERSGKEEQMNTAEAPEQLPLGYGLADGIAVVHVTGEVDVASCGALRHSLLRIVTDEASTAWWSTSPG